MTIERFRNSAKAIIIEEDRILTICRHDPKYGEWYILPGGGQNPGETLHEALRREAREEADIEIEIGPLALVREYVGARHEFADTDGDLHQVEFMFFCRRAPGSEPSQGKTPDDDQVRVEWLRLGDLGAKAFYPKALIPLLGEKRRRIQSATDAYMGDVN